ncbi:MAG: DEAD/DEAH box helicase [Acidimicrobiia bacterium]
MDPRRFAEDRGLTLDSFQRDAMDALDAGSSVLVCAPTGAGKTLIAEFAVVAALGAGGRAFYTTPIKALSNQKYRDLREQVGESRVGLLTGDTSISPRASIVVMTTEVLRNMLYADSPALKGLGTVVLDEVHYLQDRARGAVWEEIIIHLPPEIGIVCLSATVSNADEFADWLREVRGDVVTVVEQERPVPLDHFWVAADRHDDLVILPTFATRRGVEVPNPDAVILEADHAPRRTRAHQRGGRRGGRGRSALRQPGRVELLDALRDRDELPAIYFIFSRAGCDRALDECVSAGVRFTTADEARRIRGIAESRTAALDDRDLDALGYSRWLHALERGLAAHHAGMVPAMKEAVEEAFVAGLVQVVFATETLALGVNMPARSVVLEKITKFTGTGHEMLTAAEYTQLGGRAGRRGLDAAGQVYVCWSPFVTFDQVAALAARTTYELRSSFRPTYNMAANLVKSHERAEAHELLNLSFAQFQSDRAVVGLERQLRKRRRDLRRAEKRGESTSRPARKVARLERRIAGRSENLSRSFDRVIGLLDSWGYVEGWSLTARGEVLAGLHCELDLVAAEMMAEGLLQDLDAPSVASVVSCCTFERRGSDDDSAPVGAPTREVGARVRRLQRISDALGAAETDADLPVTRAIDSGFAHEAYEWTRGDALADVLADDITGGDFVRCVRQLLDLLRQVAEAARAAGERETAGVAAEAADAALRGVIAASEER